MARIKHGAGLPLLSGTCLVGRSAGSTLASADDFAVRVGHGEQFQLVAAMRTGRVLARARCWRREQDAVQPIRPTPPQPDQPPHVGQLQFAVGTQEAVVANFLKAGRREHAAEAHFLATQVMRVLQQRADRLAAGAEDRFLRTRPQISYPIFFSLTLPSPRYSCCAGRGEGTGNR